MINASIVNTLLKAILGQTSPIGRDSTTQNRAYICLGTSVSPTAEGDIGEFVEPDANSGYSRYLIGAYDWQGNPGSLVNKCSIANGEAINTDTLYFDEAKADWPEIHYFGIANSLTATPIAYGYIIDDEGHRTSLNVHTGQVPIIRKSQLQLSIRDLKDLPTEKYYAKVSYQDETTATTILYKLEINTTNIIKVQNNIMYTQFNITDLTEVTPQGLTPVVTLEENDTLFIPNFKQILDQETLSNFYDNNMVVYPQVKIQVYTNDPDQE